MERRITVRTLIPPGAAKSELRYPEFFQRCRNLGTRRPEEGAEESLAVREITPIQILSGLTIKEHRGIRTWAQQQHTSCCSHSFASFRDFQKYPSGERRLGGAHQRRRGQGAKPGRGARDAESRRSSPGILLSPSREVCEPRSRSQVHPAQSAASGGRFQNKARVQANARRECF